MTDSPPFDLQEVLDCKVEPELEEDIQGLRKDAGYIWKFYNFLPGYFQYFVQNLEQVEQPLEQHYSNFRNLYKDVYISQAFFQKMQLETSLKLKSLAFWPRMVEDFTNKCNKLIEIIEQINNRFSLGGKIQPISDSDLTPPVDMILS